MMIHSALFFFVVLAVACADVPFTGTVRNHIPADAPPAEISMAFKNAIPNDPGRSVVGVLVTYPAGGATPSHRHAPSAFITGYILSGLIRSQVEGEPTAKVYKAGEYFTENPGSRHIVSANGDPNGGTSSFLATFVVNSNETEILVIPDPVPYVPSV